MKSLWLKKNVLASYGSEDADSFQDKLQAFFTNNVLLWITWGVTILFTLLVIKAGINIAMAKSPEEKQAAKGKLISLGIGLAIVLCATVLVTVVSSIIKDNLA